MAVESEPTYRVVTVSGVESGSKDGETVYGARLLELRVNEALADGWRPLGGVQAYQAGPSGPSYAQAMYRSVICPRPTPPPTTRVTDDPEADLVDLEPTDLPEPPAEVKPAKPDTRAVRERLGDWMSRLERGSGYTRFVHKWTVGENQQDGVWCKVELGSPPEKMFRPFSTDVLLAVGVCIKATGEALFPDVTFIITPTP